MSQQIKELIETDKTCLSDWIVYQSNLVPMYDPRLAKIYALNQILVTVCENGVFALFANDNRRSLIIAASLDPLEVRKGPAYNQLVVDSIFSIANLAMLSVFTSKNTFTNNNKQKSFKSDI